MKRYFFPYLAVLLATAISSIAAFGETKAQEENTLPLTLQDVLDIAIINNFDIQLAKYDRAIKETDVDDALSVYDTVITMDGAYTHNKLEKATVLAGGVSEDYEAGLGVSKKIAATGTDVGVAYRYLRDRTDSSFITINPSEESYVKLTLTQPLMRNILGINDWADVKAAKIEVNNFKSETLDNIEKSLSEAEMAFWRLLLVQQMASLREEAWKRADEFTAIVEEKKEIGSAELTDLYAAKANLKVRSADLALSNSDLAASENELKLLMNNNEAGSSLRLAPLGEIAVSQEDIALAQALKAAFDNRRDYRRAMNDIKIKEIKVAMKRNERWPQLDLEGSFKMNGVRRSLLGSIEDVINETNTEYYAGAAFSFPLEGREAKSAYDKAVLEKAKALVELKKIEKAIVTNIDSRVKAVNAHRQRVNEFSQMAQFQKYKMQEEVKKYRYGRSDSDRMTRFQQDYLDAEIALRLALLDYQQALVNLYLDENVYLAERGLIAP